MNPNATAASSKTWDVIIVGSGAGGMAAACAAAAGGCKVLMLEHADVIGGTTAISGGMIWLPANEKMAAAGRTDTIDAARRYLEATVPGTDRTRLKAFLANGNDVLRDIEARTFVRLQPVMSYPDYYPELAGSTPGGRVLEPVPFDARALGPSFRMLRSPLPEFMLLGGMMISRQDIPHLRRTTKSPRSAARTLRLVSSYALQRLTAHRGTSLYLGNALMARFLKSALDLGVTIRTSVTVERIAIDDNGCVTIAHVAGGERLEARRGIVLATGGISDDTELRRRYTPEAAGTLTATVGDGAARRGARLAMDVGAALCPPTTDGAFWVPASPFTRTDGSRSLFPHTVTDRAKPGLIAVDATGQRFVNEAVSYHEFVRAQLRNADRAIPAWLLCDADFLWKYGLGRIRPFRTNVGDDVTSGYLKRGATLAALAAELEVPSAALEATAAEFNRHAAVGGDPAFGRGQNVYQRSLGDADVKPNPCVAPIIKPPFYAVAVWPADLGMAAGLETDAQARVLDGGGRSIPGLYACGNDMASVMAGAYPGPGITLGPAIVFGWLAGRRLAEDRTGE